MRPDPQELPPGDASGRQFLGLSSVMGVFSRDGRMLASARTGSSPLKFIAFVYVLSVPFPNYGSNYDPAVFAIIITVIVDSSCPLGTENPRQIPASRRSLPPAIRQQRGPALTEGRLVNADR
jgi:hypothetical protein